MLEDSGHGPAWLQFLSALPSIHNLGKVRFVCTCFLSTQGRHMGPKSGGAQI